MCPCRSTLPVAGLVLLLLVTCVSAAPRAPKTGSHKNKLSPPRNTKTPQGFPNIPGINVLELYRSNPSGVKAAYKECMKHGGACKIPCASITNCAACHPSGKATVCAFCMPGHVLSADQKRCIPSRKSTPGRKAGDKRQDEPVCGGSAYRRFGVYGCVADLTSFTGSLPTQRCAVRVTENPTHYDACSSSPTYPSPISTKCTQVSISSAPIISTCHGLDNCTAQQGTGCWVQAFNGDRSYNRRIEGWIQSGPDCATDPYSYLAPCPYSKCRTAPSCDKCTVEAALLLMREAPCATAPIVMRSGREVIIPQGASFQYLDINSRQSENCAAYGLVENMEQTASYCWVLGQYQGITGWVPVQKLNKNPDTGIAWASALCEYEGFFEDAVPELLVSDDGSTTGCAQLTKVLTDVANEFRANSREAFDEIGDGCFPADAAVTLRNGKAVRMSQLELGDKVAVRTADGSMAWSSVYAFGHRDDLATAEFVETTVTAEGVASSIQATADHFVLVGSVRPVYKRAGQVVVGDTLWMSAPGANFSSQMVPATVTTVQAVINTGLYAPMTLSGSIIVNNIATSVHSTWFADRAWLALGLPDAWLHTLYQAVLAPVRFLWHVLPNYTEVYARVEQHYGITATVPNLVEFANIIAWVLKDVVAQSSLTLATTISVALAAHVALASSSNDQPVRARKRMTSVGPLVLLVFLSMAAIVTAVSTDGVANASAVYSKPYYGDSPSSEDDSFSSGDDKPLYSRHHHDVRHDEETDREHYRSAGPHYGPNHCGVIQGCCSPPDVDLPYGHWACSGDTVPFGGKCIGICDGSGYAEATCTPEGWKQVVGACYKLAVCSGLPTAPVNGGYWPESCQNTLVGDFCISQCNDPARCLTFQQAIVRCGVDAWQQTTVTALDPISGVPLGCGAARCTGQPELPEGGDIAPDCDATAIGDSCSLSCGNVFFVAAECTADGWDTPGACESLKCTDQPDPIAGGAWNCAETPLGGLCTAACDNGGTVTAQCEYLFWSFIPEWSNPQGCCNCPEPKVGTPTPAKTTPPKDTTPKQA